MKLEPRMGDTLRPEGPIRLLPDMKMIRIILINLQAIKQLILIIKQVLPGNLIIQNLPI